MTNQTEYTPGPWRAPVTADAERLLVTSDNGEIVCTVWGKNFLDDARLIATAPELLAALKTLVDECDTNHDFAVNPHGTEYEALEAASAAIRKAQGDTQ